MSRVYIGNLGDNASKREIEEEFRYYGSLKDVWVARNPPGFAFCVFEDKRDAEDAVRELDGKYIGGVRIRVELARGPLRGGRAARLGLTEKCYDCGRVGHFARDCTRKGSGSERGENGRENRSSSGRRRSRSRSPSRRQRRSRSRSPRYRRSRSRSHSNEKKSRSASHSRSPSGERKSPSPFREKRKERSRSRSGSPKQDKQSPKDNGDPPRSPSKSRSPSPALQNNEGDE